MVDQLGQDIVRGVIAVGATLPGDAELSERFGVSRTVLREAIKTLAAKGLVQARTRVGTRVCDRRRWNLFDPEVLTWHLEAGLDGDFYADITEVRLALEPFSAALASQRADGADIDRLRALAGAMADCGHSEETLAKADLAFHLAVAEAARNPFLRAIGSLIEAALLAALRLSSSHKVADRSEAIAASHMRIVDAIARRDGEGARQAMEAVIRTGVERVSTHLPASARLL